MWALIGGSGFEKFDAVKAIKNLDENTPFGKTSEGFKLVEVNGHKALFIPRHGLNHNLTPSEVNYRANIFALKREGATKLMALSAVGSLAEEYAPGDVVVPKQFIDRTKSLRKISFCGEGLVSHVSLAEPVSEVLVSYVRSIAKDFDFKIHFDKTHITIEGPYFSTVAESKLYIAQGAHTIGMTSFPEYALARQAGLAYLPCCFVTDYDCWRDEGEHVTVDEVMRVMAENNKKGFELVKQVLACEQEDVLGANAKALGLSSGLMTPKEAWSDSAKQWLPVLLT